MEKLTKRQIIPILILTVVLFLITIFISLRFNPYAECTETPAVKLRVRLVFSELCFAAETLSTFTGIENHPEFQEFVFSSGLGGFIAVGLFLGLDALWHIIEEELFDTWTCTDFKKKGMIWVVHYFTTYIVMYIISLVAYGVAVGINRLYCFFNRINQLAGTAFILVIAIPLCMLYMFCLVFVIRMLKYLAFCIGPLWVVDRFLLPLKSLFYVSIDTLLCKPWMLLGLLLLLMYERVCVQLLLKDDW